MSAPTPYESFFRTRDVFTTAEFQAYLAQRMPARQSRYHAILHYYKTKKRLVRIRRGLYAPVPSYASGSHVPVDPWVLASKMTLDAVLAYHSALESHGVGYSVWNRAVYASQRPLKPLVRKDCMVIGVSFPTALRRKREVNVETETALCYGTEVRAATLERAVVDCLDRPYLSGGWEEIGRALEFAEDRLRIDRLVAYACKLNNAFTNAKVGYFLDLYQESLTFRPQETEELLRRVPRQPRYLDHRGRTKGRLIAKWNLIVPPWVHERMWDEEI